MSDRINLEILIDDFQEWINWCDFEGESAKHHVVIDEVLYAEDRNGFLKEVHTFYKLISNKTISVDGENSISFEMLAYLKREERGKDIVSQPVNQLAITN